MLYEDGTLAFSSTNEPIAGKTVISQYGDVSEKTYGISTSGNTTTSNAPWYGYRGSITAVEFVDKIAPMTMNGWFYNLVNVKEMKQMENLDTSNLINMIQMFRNCNSLTSIDVSNFDTSKVTSMTGMFDGCSSLTSIDVSSFDTSNVTSMMNMFMGCSSLTQIEFGIKWNKEVNLPTPSISGFKCDGWYKGDEKLANAGGKYTPRGPITIYAKLIETT